MCPIWLVLYLLAGPADPVSLNTSTVKVSETKRVYYLNRRVAPAEVRYTLTDGGALKESWITPVHGSDFPAKELTSKLFKQSGPALVSLKWILYGLEVEAQKGADWTKLESSLLMELKALGSKLKPVATPLHTGQQSFREIELMSGAKPELKLLKLSSILATQAGSQRFSPPGSWPGLDASHLTSRGKSVILAILEQEGIAGIVAEFPAPSHTAPPSLLTVALSPAYSWEEVLPPLLEAIYQATHDGLQDPGVIP